jgi:hypothetical protein
MITWLGLVDLACTRSCHGIVFGDEQSQAATVAQHLPAGILWIG